MVKPSMSVAHCHDARCREGITGARSGHGCRSSCPSFSGPACDLPYPVSAADAAGPNGKLQGGPAAIRARIHLLGTALGRTAPGRAIAHPMRQIAPRMVRRAALRDCGHDVTRSVAKGAIGGGAPPFYSKHAARLRGGPREAGPERLAGALINRRARARDGPPGGCNRGNARRRLPCPRTTTNTTAAGTSWRWLDPHSPPLAAP